MALRISAGNTLFAQNQLNRNQASLREVSKRLATGLKINTGKDDPAGLIVSERLSAELKSLRAQNRGYQRNDSNANIAAGHAAQLSSLFQDLNVLVLSSSNQAGMSKAEIAANQMQIDNISSSIQRFANDASAALNGVNLPDGGNAKVEALYDNARVAAASVKSGGANDLASGNYEAAQTALDSAGTDIATARGTIGTYQKDTIGPQIRSNLIAIENITESRSRIRDTDYAVETSNLVRAGILTDVGVKILKIAQEQARSVLALLS